MTYCVSDLHGRYDLYMKLLKRLKLSEEDRLYILGDLVDRGPEGLKIVLDVAKRENVICLMGNHDLTAQFILSKLLGGLTAGQLADLRELYGAWVYDGGDTTIAEFKALSLEDRRLAVMTLDSFRNYAEVKAGGNHFVLCHGGIDNYEPTKPLREYTIADLAFCREDYTKPKFSTEGVYLVTGHTPTAAIEGGEAGRIFYSHDHIAIDCGAVFGFGLGCLCLDTLQEIYVS